MYLVTKWILIWYERIGAPGELLNVPMVKESDGHMIGAPGELLDVTIVREGDGHRISGSQEDDVHSSPGHSAPLYSGLAPATFVWSGEQIKLQTFIHNLFIFRFVRI